MKQRNNSSTIQINYVSAPELKKVPYIINIPTDKQAIYSYSYFDEGKKQFLWKFPNSNHEFNYISAVPLECLFYSKTKVDIEKDLFIDFFNVIICKYSHTFAKTSIDAIAHDILNLSAVFEKYFLFLNYMSSTPEKYKMILIRTEIEYFFGVIRSLYDLLQILIKHFVTNYTKIKLPDKYSDIFDKDTHEMRSKWPKLPKQLNIYYKSSAEFFFKCRDIRNGIYHHGVTNNFISYSVEGFGISRDSFDFSGFDIWPQDKVKNNNVVSLLALFAYITKTVIQNMNELAFTLLEAFSPKNPFIQTII